MNIYCIVPTWKEFPTEAFESIKIQKQKPEIAVIGIDDSKTNSEIAVGDVIYRIEIFHGERVYAAYNIFLCIDYLNMVIDLEDDDVICLIDGDDRLFDEWSLVEIFKAHNLGAWLTYGSYIKKSCFEAEKNFIHGDVELCQKYRGSYRNNEDYRQLPWRASHLKTFRYGLYRRLKPDWFKGPDGEPLRVCSDLALMFPMLEMAGKEHIKHINKPLYIYNDMSEFNDHKVRGQEQKEVEAWIRMQEPYKRVHYLSGAGAAVVR